MIVQNVVSKAPRWYDKDGNAIWEIVGKNGNPKKPDIRDARREGLFPSVTTIISQLSKPGLEKWKISQAIISSLTLPRNPEESDQDFAERIALDAQEEGKAAATKGTDIHSCLETYIRTNVVPEGGKNICLSYNNFMEPFPIERGSLEVEFKATNLELGYGGRGDLIFRCDGKTVVVDFKSQDVKNGKPEFYPDWGMQLAAYAKSKEPDLQNVIGYSLVFNRNTGMAYWKEWDDLETQFKKFKMLLNYFQLDKGLPCS
jgi:hypothetical protein